MEGRNREVRRLWESQGVVVSRLKRVRFGPVFITSDLTMGRWREMSQREVDILSEEVGLKPVALPDMKEKTRDKLDRLQRKSAKPVGRGERPQRTLRPAHGGPKDGEQARSGRASRDENAERPVRTPRPPRAGQGRAGEGKGTAVAERPQDMNKKRPAKPKQQRPGVELSERPARKPAATPVKRRSSAEGQRPGPARGDRKPQ
jgi:23S rRNA pseudouridine2605 synthase